MNPQYPQNLDPGYVCYDPFPSSCVYIGIVPGSPRDEGGLRVPRVGRAAVVFRRPTLSPERPARIRFPLAPLFQSLLARRKMSLRRIPNAPQSAQHHSENIPVVVVRKPPPLFVAFILVGLV